jgi:hypothetical protein
MFRMDILIKGTIVALENTDQNRAFIVIKGEVSFHKKLFSLESNDCEERQQELNTICHNQSLHLMKDDDFSAYKTPL